MKQVYFLRALLFVLFIGVSSIAIQAHTIDRPSLFKGNRVLDRPAPAPIALGAITIVASGGDSENSTWSYSSGKIVPLSSTAVNLNVSDVLAKLALGNLTISSSNININAVINNAANANRITFKATDNIIVAANISITTNGGDVILWANSDASGNGAITLSDSTTINTANGSTASGLSGGGRIVLAGGADDGSNGGVASDSIPDGLATSSITDGVKLGTTTGNITLMYSGGGDIIIRGNGSLSGGNFWDRAGVFQFGRWSANAGKGAINIKGTSTTFYGINFVEPSVNTNTGDKHLVLVSDKGTGDAIKITGSSTSSYGVVFNYDNPKEVLATGGGNISITGTAGGDKGVFLQNQDLLASAGSITVDGGTLGVRITTNGARIGARTGTAITSSSADILLRGNVFNFDQPASITSIGTLTLQPFGTSFSSTLTWPISTLTVTGITGLTLGKAGNTANITLSNPVSIGGPVTIYGGNIAINGSLTATNANINLHATGSVTQSAPLTAKGLGLHGAGTFTLTNTSNLVETFAGGVDSAKLGSLNYTQTGNLSIGQVNPTGIHSNGEVSISTETGNITIAQDISSESTLSDAIIINAGKSKAAGDATGGNITISGAPAITAGKGAIIKLFSGSKEGSKGLRSFVSDAVYQRFSVDENSTYDPVLTAGGTYALYRGEKPDNSLHFDGVDDYVNVTEKTFGSVTNAITLEAWIYLQNNTKLLQGIFVKAKGGGSADCNYGLRVFYNKIVLNVGNGTQSYAVLTDDTIPLNTWVHVAGSFQQGSNGKMYINGQRVSATPILFDSTLTFGDLSGTASHIGDYPYPGYDQYFQGKIDEVRVWNVARSQAEISSSYCGPLTGTETGLLAYYDFKQGVAGGDNTAIDSLYDVTSGANNGKLNNFDLNGSTSNFVESDRFADAGTISGPQSVSVGGTITLTVTGNSATGTWGSTHSSVATIDSSGVVTGLSVGTDSVYYVVGAPGGCDGTDTAFYAITVSPDNSLHFDGVDDYVNVNEQSLGSVTNALSLEAWIKPENLTGAKGIFIKATPNDGTGKTMNYGLRLRNGQLIMTLGNGSQFYELTSDTTLGLNNWVHVAATFEQNTGGKFYINGRLVTATANPDGTNTLIIGNLSGTESNIGRYSNAFGQYFQGKIDELRIWNVVRSQSEISSSYCGPLTGTETGLLAYYNFNQGVAGGDNTAIDSLYDLTSGANNGGLNNFTLNGSTSNFVESDRVADAGIISGSTSVCVAGTITLTVTGNSAKGTWGSTRPSVATVDTLGVVTGLLAGSDSVYYVVAGQGGCYGTDTAFYAITVNPKTLITAEPVGATLSVNDSTTLSVTADGTGLHYAWYSKADSSYYNPSPATPDDTTASYTPPAQSAINTTYYYVIVTGDCGSDTSKIVGVRTLSPAEFDANVSIHSKHAGIYSDTVWVRARLVDASTKRAIEGGTVIFTIYNGDNPGIGTANSNRVPAVTDDKGFARSYILITQDPDWTDPFDDNNGDSMHISAYFAGDRTYASSQKVENFNVKAETAEFVELGTDPNNPEPGLADANKIKFNGKLGSGYIETPNNTVDVTVAVNIQEKLDDYPGDITKANVRFELSPAGGSTPLIIDQRPDVDGNVSVTFNSVPVGPYGSNSFTVHVTAGDYYRARLNSTLTLHKKGVASLFCGGGDIQIASSTGKYAADAGTVASFSVGSKYNKTASKVQGAASLIFTSNGRTYEVKGSGTPTVTFDSVAGVASYVSAASITDITLDSSGTVATIISPSSLTLAYNLKDSATDLVSIKVADAATVWFANQGTGSVADRQILIRGGMAITFNIAAPTANSATRCGPGTVTLTATPPSGATVDWYDAPTGGNKLMAGALSFTVSAASNVTYYAEARNTTTNALSATRTPATITINAQPDVPAVTNGARCGSGSVVLNATLPANTTIAWYSAAAGGKALGTASSYTTPNISVTTNYYAETKSTLNGCASAARAVATATINALPTAPITTSAASCGPGTVTLGATTAQSGKQIEWYTASKGGSSFNVGTTYTIANLTATTTFYTLSKDTTTGCASSTRTAVTATVSSIPAAPASISGTVSICPSSTTALTFTAAKVSGATSYQWTKPSCATGSSTTNSISLTFSSAGANDQVSVKAVNSYGCASASKSVPVTTNATCSSCTALSTGSTSGVITSQMSSSGTAQMEVYPNPNNGRFNLSLKGFETGTAVVRIVRIDGSVFYMKQHNLLNGLTILPLTIKEAKQGVFFIQVMQKGKTSVIKLLKE